MQKLIVITVLAGSALAAPQAGDPGSAEFVTASELVKQLGDTKFAVREESAKKLLEMGRTSIAALRDGAKSDDEEIRSRCVSLIAKVKAAEWKRRADAYVADVDGKQQHDLPLLAEFENAVGRPDASARKLFADMMRTNGELLDVVAIDSKRGKAACLERAKALLDQLRRQPKVAKIDVADLATIVLIDSAAGAQPDPGAEATVRLIHMFNATVANIGQDVGPEVRHLIARWALVRLGLFKDPDYRIVPDVFFQFVAQSRFPEIVPVLVKIVHSREAGPWAVRAVRSIADLDGKEAAEALEKIMLDKSLTFKAKDRANRVGEYRIGDYALAASLRKHNKNLADFGLQGQDWFAWNVQDAEASGYDFLKFANEEARTKAVQKWKEEVVGKK